MTSIARAIVTFVCLLLLPTVAVAVVLFAACAIAWEVLRPFVVEQCEPIGQDLGTRGSLALIAVSLLMSSAHGTTGGDA